MLKTLRERAVQDASRLAESAKNAMSSEPCGRCGMVYTVPSLQLRTCGICMRRICGLCMDKVMVPEDLVDQRSSEAKKKTVSSSTTSMQAVCKAPCMAMCVEVNVQKFREAVATSHVANLEACLQGGASAVECYERPGSAAERTGAVATCRRLVPVAVEFLKLTGYGAVAEYAYRAFEAGSLAAIMTSPEVRLFCERIYPVLRRHFFLGDDTTDKDDARPSLATKLTSSLTASKKATTEASELALRLYYFGCATAIDRLVSPANELASDSRGAAEVDAAMAKAGGEAAGAAQWLYVARTLRAPHDGPDWAAWYAGQLASRSGWTMVACVGASRSESDLCAVPRLPPTPFPAWCLVVRCATKTALLSIRGSVTRADWVINSDLEPEDLGRGDCHGGFLRAAKAVLDDCGSRRLILRLFDEGYDLQVVGHSMGAGVGALVTALLDDEARSRGRSVECVAYAAPACVSPQLADALQDRVLSVVHRDDLVPRLSDANCAILARDLVADDANYRRRLAADKAALADHLRTLGKANSMVDNASDLDAADAVEADFSLPADDRPERLVVPGKILYLTTRDGAYVPILGDHRSLAAHLDRVVVSSHAVEDHRIEAHLDALRRARWARGRIPPPTAAPPFRPATDGRQYATCSCCASNTTWTSIAPGSDSARAYSTHHCRACGQVVCAFCAPAADVVAGDGLGQTLKLPDRRLSLPSLRFFAPVRVCYPCAFKAYDL